MTHITTRVYLKSFNTRLQRVIKPALLSAAMLAGALVMQTYTEAAVIGIPPVVVQTLTHTFTPESSFPFPQQASVRDSFTIGDGNYTGGGAFSIPSISTGDSANIRVQAPAGKKFVIHNPAVQLVLNLFWQAGGDAISLSGGSVLFENLVGAPPANTYTFLGVGNAGNVIKADLQYTLAGVMEFTALDITIPVQSSPAVGSRNFGTVQSNSSPAFYFFAESANDQSIMSIQAIPEPSMFALLAIAGGGLFLLRRRSTVSVLL